MKFCKTVSSKTVSSKTVDNMDLFPYVAEAKVRDLNPKLTQSGSNCRL